MDPITKLVSLWWGWELTVVPRPLSCIYRATSKGRESSSFDLGRKRNVNAYANNISSVTIPGNATKKRTVYQRCEVLIKTDVQSLTVRRGSGLQQPPIDSHLRRVTLNGDVKTSINTTFVFLNNIFYSNLMKYFIGLVGLLKAQGAGTMDCLYVFPKAILYFYWFS